MAIIDYTYFTGLISIDTSRPESKEKLDYYIDYTEEFYMKKLLGDLYYEYTIEPMPAEYVSLLELSTVNYCGKKWTNDVKKMIANFTYFEYVKDQAGFNTILGEMKANTDNSQQMLPVSKLVRAYNMGVDLYEGAIAYVISNSFYCNPEEIEKINEFEL